MAEPCKVVAAGTVAFALAAGTAVVAAGALAIVTVAASAAVVAVASALRNRWRQLGPGASAAAWVGSIVVAATA